MTAVTGRSRPGRPAPFSSTQGSPGQGKSLELLRIELLNNLLESWQRNKNVDQINFSVVIIAT